MPKISIIIPVYKVEKYLDRCINSIVAQTFTDFELILVDDGSPDQSPQICDKWAEKDSRIKVIHKKNEGAAIARNVGIDWTFINSDSEWLSFVDSDDWILPQTLETLFNTAQSTNTNISICNYTKADDDTILPEQQSVDSEIWNPEEFFVQRRNIATLIVGKLYRKSCFVGERYTPGKIIDDEYIVYRLLFKEKSVSFVESQLYIYYQNPTSTMHNLSFIHAKHALQALEEQLKYFKQYNFRIAYDRQKLIIGYTIHMYLTKIPSSPHDATQVKSNETKKAKKLMKKMLRKYVCFKDNEYIYEAVYPKLMKWYWRLQAVKKKIFR